MPLFGNSTRVQFDLTYGRPELAQVYQAARSRDHEAVTQAITTDVLDSEDRIDRILIAAKTANPLVSTKVPAWVEEWSADRPQDATATVTRAAVETLRAWNIRGDALASDTSRQALAGFQEALDRAEGFCRRAIIIDPLDAAPWYWLIYIARGQQVGWDETVARWRGFTKRNAYGLSGHLETIYSMAPRWGFAAECMYAIIDMNADAPDGSLVHSLMPAAHMERYQRMGGAQQDQLLADPEARRQVDAAAAKMGMAGERRPADHVAHNQFACWYTMTGEYAKARPHVEFVNGYTALWPWGYTKRGHYGGLRYAIRKTRNLK